MELTDLRGLGPKKRDLLQGAGVSTLGELARADAEAVAARTGIAAEQIRGWQAEVRRTGNAFAAGPTLKEVTADAQALVEKASTLAVTKADEMRVVASEKAGEMRVVLQDKAEKARVRVGAMLHDGLPIFTLKSGEDEESLLSRIKGEAVVLREKADTAVVRVNEAWHREVPIFEEKVAKAGEDAKEIAREVRVTVDEIREHKKPAKKAIGGFLARFGKRMSKD